jgi:glycine cleavage system H lipoate-binding protein
MERKIAFTGFKTVPKGEDKCIWMEARVIDFKLCNNNYNCFTCAFDKAMKETADRNSFARAGGMEPEGKKSHIVSWQERMQKSTGLNRKCRHSLTGRAPARLCPNHFECLSCEFDQMLEDTFELQIPYRLTNIPQIDGYRLPDGHFFHMGHAWARVEYGGRIRIGLDDFSMRLFGPVDKIELPLIGEEVKFSDVGLSFKRKGKNADVLAPVTGIVTATNYEATKEPTVVKEEPYNEGWLMVIEPVEMKKNLKNLMYGSDTAAWISAEHQRLVEMVSLVGMTYADGGCVEDVVGNVPELSWEKLTMEFLRT